jgi:hypothetical protein
MDRLLVFVKEIAPMIPQISLSFSSLGRHWEGKSGYGSGGKIRQRGLPERGNQRTAWT